MSGRSPGALFGAHLLPSSAAASSPAAAPSPQQQAGNAARANNASASSSSLVSVQATSIPTAALNAVASAAASNAAAPASSSVNSAQANEALQDASHFPTLLPKVQTLVELLEGAGPSHYALWEAPASDETASAATLAPPQAPVPSSSRSGGGLALGSSADDELAYSLESHVAASAARANRKPTATHDAIVRASQQLAVSYNAARAAVRALGEGADMSVEEIRRLEGALGEYEDRLGSLVPGSTGQGDVAMA